ncbi:D-lactate dehydrogenase [Only Syngen Nebraska virus 5]|uniref:D-lactate dehydrogenase n=1 Tax=Only Syngen Nebraska virus 5 TaxID=1917232 RepID=UPI000901DE4B|nr:D-lactate dehydrogenase [Only Syngen Nebraska virus 5]APC25528.1 D-lactate dehydrogenase [Only Syngen Nebraska virus 5]
MVDSIISYAMSGKISPRSSPKHVEPKVLKPRVAVFSAGNYVKNFIKPIETICDPKYIESSLSETTAILADKCDAVNAFVNDDLSAPVLDILKICGVSTITLRCAGFDRLDIEHAKELGFNVYRVPAYSPRSVAELALTHMMALSRNMQLVMPRVKTGNYTMEGLVGREITDKTIGIVGTGKIAQEFIKLVKPMAGRIIAYDVYENDIVKDMGVEYTSLDNVIREADVLSLHCPLMKSTFHMINEDTLKTMKKTAIVVNTARGGLIDTEALIDALENGTISGCAMDVYEHESGLFFTDRAVLPIEDRMKFWDKKFARLANLPNAIVSPHVAFLTKEALKNIADTTVENLTSAFSGERNGNMVF